MKRYTFNVDATSVHGSQTYYVDAESEELARDEVEGGGGVFVCEELEVQDLGKFELVEVEDVPVDNPDAVGPDAGMMTDEQIMDIFYADHSIDACDWSTVVSFGRALLAASIGRDKP